jgi:hypothetical protein
VHVSDSLTGLSGRHVHANGKVRSMDRRLVRDERSRSRNSTGEFSGVNVRMAAMLLGALLQGKRCLSLQWAHSAVGNVWTKQGHATSTLMSCHRRVPAATRPVRGRSRHATPACCGTGRTGGRLCIRCFPPRRVSSRHKRSFQT